MSEHNDFIIQRLSEAPIFEAVASDELAALADEVEVVHLNAGSTLAEQGDEPDGAYLLVSGRLRAFARQSDGTEVPVGEIAAGELVGEMALLNTAKRSATVRAIRDSELFLVKTETFNRLIHARPEATLAIARVLVERLERSNAGRQQVPPRRAVALVPTFGECRDSMDSLIAVIQRMTDATVVDQSTIGANLGEQHTEAEVVHWLHRLEAESDLVVYVADSVASPWGGRCLRQADHIVAIDADPAASRQTRVIETLDGLTMGAVGPTVDAVCVQPSHAQRARGGSRWQQNHHIRVHHIRKGSARDLNRIARSILRRDIGLVLSGGGARGMAHVGVIRAFEEASIPIDVVGGTSFGAIVAMMASIDLGWQAIRDILWDQLAQPGAPIDITPPTLAISKGERLVKLLRNTFDEGLIENAWLRSFCVSSNLTTGHPLIHQSGSTATALRASVAIPGVFPPVATGDGEVLVDGAVMNNLPVDVMSGFSNGGPIVAVNLRAPVELAAGDLPLDGIVSGWTTLGRRLNPTKTNVAVPSLVEILARASEVGGAEAARALEQDADYVLHPPTGDHALLEFGALDDLIRLGYEYTAEELRSWEEAGRSLAGSDA